MRINTKIIGFLIISFFLVSVFLGLTSMFTLSNSQRDNLKVFKNELLETNRELIRESATLFFRLLDKRLQENDNSSSHDVLKIISEIDPSCNKHIVVMDISKKSCYTNFDREELARLLDSRIVDRYLNEMLLTRNKDFYLDNYRQFLLDKKAVVIPTAAFFRIYDAYGLIIGHGEIMVTAKVRIDFVKKRNLDYFRLQLLFSILVYLFAVAIAVLSSSHFMRILFILPLEEISSGVNRIAKGDLNTRIAVRSKDEIGQLASAFNAMTENLQKVMVSRDELIKEITERKKAETHLKTILDAVQAGIILIDPESHRIIDINPVAVNMFGMPKEKVVGSVCHKFICPAEVGKCPITELGQTVDNSERVLVNARGQKIPILKTVVSVLMGGHRYLLESFVDLSKHKKIEEERERLIKELEEERELLKKQKQELEDSRRAIKNVAEDLKESKDILEYQKKSLEAINKELDDFTYIVSHDLKEPLRSIDAYSKFIVEDFQEKLSQDGKHYLERIRSNTERMKKLIEDLLEISRLKKKGSTIEEVDAEELIGEVKMRLEYAINQKGVEVIIKDKLPKIFCDRLRLTEVFLNLISNAIKFNDKPKPIIEIGCSSKGDFYEFYVKDNGIGIKEEYYDKIFEIFQRLGKREDNEGTGAGLTIVKKIIQMHRGNIWLESKIGEGATFYFTIPKEKSMVLGKKLIGEILIERKLITEEEIKKALEEQEKKNIEMTEDKQSKERSNEDAT